MHVPVERFSHLSLRRPIFVHAVAGAIYTLIALLYTYPQIRILSSGFVVSPVGSSSDYNLLMWAAWWTKKALLDLKINPFYTNYLFYPNGISLVLHELTPLNSVLTIPFQLIMGRPSGIILGCNIAILFTFAIAGVGMFALVRYLTRNNLAAFFAGAAFAFCPYRSMHIVHTALLSTGWIPLYLLFLLKTLREKGRWLNPVVAALFAALTFLSCMMYIYFLVLLTALFLAWAAAFERAPLFERQTLLRFSLLAGLSALMLLPFLAAIAGGGSAQSQPESMVEMFSANVAGYVLPADKHVLYRFLYRLMPDFSYYLSGVPGHASFLTFTVILLAVAGLAKTPVRLTAFWLGLFLVFLILSLGPFLHVWKWTTSIPLPYLVLYKYLPFFGIMRTPYRFIVLAEIGIIVLACFGLKEVESKFSSGQSQRKKRFGYAVCGGIIFLLLLELWNVPFNKYFPPAPAIYEKMSHEEGNFAVLDYPIDQYSLLTNYMYYQTLHEKPIPTGVLSRIDPKLEQFRLQLNQELNQPVLSPEKVEQLKELNIKYVVHHRPDKPEEIIAVVKIY